MHTQSAIKMRPKWHCATRTTKKIEIKADFITHQMRFRTALKEPIRLFFWHRQLDRRSFVYLYFIALYAPHRSLFRTFDCLLSTFSCRLIESYTMHTAPIPVCVSSMPCRCELRHVHQWQIWQPRHSWLLRSKLNYTLHTHLLAMYRIRAQVRSNNHSSSISMKRSRNGNKNKYMKNRCHSPGILCVWFEADLNAIFFDAMRSAKSANIFAPPNWSAEHTIRHIDCQHTCTNHIRVEQ